MVTNIILFAAPILISPLIVYLISRLFPIFIDQGARMFVAMELPGSITRKVGMDIAVHCVAIYLFCWIAAYGCFVLEGPYMLTVGICISAVFIAIYDTISLIKKKIGVKTWLDAMLIGILTYTGGNLPLFIIIPLLLFFFSS